MKRIVSLLILVLMILCLTVHASELTLYNADGVEVIIPTEQELLWRAVGWCDWDQVHTTVYAPDGRTLDVLTKELQRWKDAGWSDDITQVQTTLYAWDGTSVTLWNSQVQEYLDNLWVYTPEEVQTTLYSADGQELTVWNAEIDAYLAAGWLLTRPGPDPNKPMVALTFDDGPGPYTDRILSCLESHGAKATFFVVGNRLNTYSAQLKREAEMGMEIGCHTWSHANLTTLSAGGVSGEVTRTNELVRSLTGICPVTVRPPYGSHNATVRSAAGAPLILWSIDTLDWKTRNANSTYNAVLDNVKDGDIILMHDIHSPTADAVELIVPALIERGYQLVTVSELAQYRGGLVNGQTYRKITN